MKSINKTIAVIAALLVGAAQARVTYEHISTEKVAPFAEACIGFADKEFRGDFIFSTGQHKKRGNQFGLLVGMEVVNVFGDMHTQYIRCMFKIKTGKHVSDYFDASPSDSRISSYEIEMKKDGKSFARGTIR